MTQKTREQELREKLVLRNIIQMKFDSDVPLTDKECKIRYSTNWELIDAELKGIQEERERILKIIDDANWDNKNKCMIFGEETMDKIKQKIKEEQGR